MAISKNGASALDHAITVDPETGAKVLIIPPIRKRRIDIRIVGDSPLITNKWSEKAKQQMRDKQMGRAVDKKSPKDPEADYQAAMYRTEDGTPAAVSLAFKAAAVEAAMVTGDLKKAQVRRWFHVLGELIPIEGEPEMREDLVRVGMGAADLRYRPIFHEWACTVPIVFDETVCTIEQIVHLFNKAGFSVGIHEWRPEKDGNYGMFHVEDVYDRGLVDQSTPLRVA